VTSAAASIAQRMTYGDDPKHSSRDRIRLRIADIDENQPVMDDERLHFYI
jgi:hypothetical protein